MNKIGKAKMGGGCMYIKSLDGVDQKALAELITTAMQAKVQRYPSRPKARKKTEPRKAEGRQGRRKG